MRHVLGLLLVSLVSGAAVAQEARPDDAVDARVAALFEEPTFRRITAGVHVVRVSDGQEVVAWQAGRPLMPASTTKVVTAAAALASLGPSFTFRTEVWRSGDVQDGVLAGDLYLKGGGDPTLVVERLWRLLRDVRSEGIERVEGDLILDDTYFAGPTTIPGWDNERDLAEGPSYFAPIGALDVEFGVAVLSLRPTREGEPAQIRFETPAGAYLTVKNDLVTGPARSRTRIEVERRVTGDGMVFEVSGSLPEGAEARTFRRTVDDPTAFTAGVVGELLATVGPKVTGRIVTGAVPQGAVRVASMPSPPLASVLMDTNKYSSNYMAESVLRAMGAELKGEGSTEAGLAVVSEYLDGLGISRDDYALRNGSGLSRDTRLSARLLTTVLLAAVRDPRIAPELVASLSIGARDGTLATRFRQLPDRVRGKTGTLAGVHTLAGYFDGDDGQTYAFAFLANDVRGGLGPVKDLMDDLIVRLARQTSP